MFNRLSLELIGGELQSAIHKEADDVVTELSISLNKDPVYVYEKEKRKKREEKKSEAGGMVTYSPEGSC